MMGNGHANTIDWGARQADIIEMLVRGARIAEIAERLKTSPRNTRCIIERYNLVEQAEAASATGRIKCSTIDWEGRQEEVVTMLREGRTVDEIAKAFGTFTSNVRFAIRRYDLRAQVESNGRALRELRERERAEADRNKLAALIAGFAATNAAHHAQTKRSKTFEDELEAVRSGREIVFLPARRLGKTYSDVSLIGDGGLWR